MDCQFDDSEVTVALQGTLDTFALPDVLRLLSTTRKVGRLRVSGDAGSGSLWFDSAMIVGSELLVRGAQADSPVEVVFHLLRFPTGSFMFEAGSVPQSNAAPRDVDSVVVEAELMLAEWRSLEAYVPSIDARLTLTTELRGRDVVIDAARWRILASVGSGATVAEVGARVGLADLAVMRSVKDVIELGLVDVDAEALPDTTVVPPPAMAAPSLRSEPASSTPAVVVPEPAPLEPLGFESAAFADPARADDDAPAAFETPLITTFPASIVDLPEAAPFDGSTVEALGMVDVPMYGRDIPFAPPSMSEMRSGLGSLPTADEARRTTVSLDSVSDESAEIARQLASLSPRAAKAVAAAAKATTEEEREAALATIEAEDESINRGLLLKFLGAVDS
jgi:hypothetical protein